MAKKDDVRTKPLESWDAYAHKQPGEALDQIHKRVHVSSKVARDWYWKSIGSKKLASRIVLGLSVALLILGASLPILAAILEESGERLLLTQLGVAALAIAGLTQAADRIFGWSSGWLRYITTATAMENATRTFDLDWADYLIQKNGVLDETDTRNLFGIARSFEDEIAKLRSDETDKWVTEFNSSVALLGELIRSQRESAEQQVTAAQKASSARGGIQVALLHSGTPVPVTVSLDGGTQDEVLGLSWAAMNLEPRIHKIHLARKDRPDVTNEALVTVKPGEVAQIEMQVP